MSTVNDVKLAKEAMIYFHNEASSYSDNYNLTFEELLDYYSKKTNGQFLEGLGFGLSQIEISSSRLRTAMESLAKEGEGKLPKWGSFFSRAGNAASQPSFYDSVSATLAGTASDVAGGFKQAGDAVIATAKNAAGLLPMLPLLALVAGGFYIYSKSKK